MNESNRRGDAPIKGAQVERERTIPALIETLSDLSGRLCDRLQLLENRLQPISGELTPPTPTNAAREKRYSPCPTGIKLAELCDLTETSAEHVEQMIARLEI